MKTAILILAPALAAAVDPAGGSASNGDSMFDFDYTETHTGSCGNPIPTNSAAGTNPGGLAVTYEMTCNSTLGDGVLSYDSSKMQAMATFLGATAAGDKLQLYGHITGEPASISGLTLPSIATTGSKPKDMGDDVANSGILMSGGMQSASGIGNVTVSNGDQTDFTVRCIVQYNSAGVATGSLISVSVDTDTTPATIGGGAVTISHETSTTHLCKWSADVDYDSTVEGEFWYGGWAPRTGQGDYTNPIIVAIPNSLYSYKHTARKITYNYAGFDFDTTLDQAVAAASAAATSVDNKVVLDQTTHGDHVEAADKLTYQMDCIADLLVNPHLQPGDAANVIYSDDPFLLQTVVICYELRVNGTADDSAVVDQEIITSLKLSDRTDVIGETCRAPHTTSGYPTMWIPTQVVSAAAEENSDAETCERLSDFYTASYATGAGTFDQAVTGFEVSAIVGEDIVALDFNGFDAQFHMVNIDVKHGSSKLETADVSGTEEGDVFYDIQTRLDTAGDGIILAEGMPFVHTRSWARVVVDTTDADPADWPQIDAFEITFDGGVKANLRNSGSDNPITSST